MMESCNRLLPTSFARFVFTRQSGGLTSERKLILNELARYDGNLDSCIEGGPHADEEKGAAASDGAIVLADTSGSARGEQDGGGRSWEKLNAEDRQKGYDFVRSTPLGRVMVLRLCLEPMRR